MAIFLVTVAHLAHGEMSHGPLAHNRTFRDWLEREIHRIDAKIICSTVTPQVRGCGDVQAHSGHVGPGFDPNRVPLGSKNKNSFFQFEPNRSEPK